MDEQLDDIKRQAIEAYVKYGTITAACKAVKIARGTWYNWLKNNPEFATAAKEAEESVADDLEEEAIRRAKNGSDTMLIFLLKGLKPERYRDRHEVTGKDGGAIQINHNGLIDKLKTLAGVNTTISTL